MGQRSACAIPTALYERSWISPTPLNNSSCATAPRRWPPSIMVHEEACEAGNGLPPEVHATVAERVRHHGLNAINMPAEWGGQGLERARPGDRAGAARAAHERALGHGLAPGERAARVRRRAARALPAAGHPRRAARLRRGHRARRRIRPERDRHDRRAGRRRLPDRRREVVRHRRRRRRLPDRARQRDARARADDVPDRQGHARRLGAAHAALHAHVRLRASGVRLRRRARRGGGRARRDRPGLRADARLVRRGAADDRGARGRRLRARAAHGHRLGGRARPGRAADHRAPADRRHDRRQRRRHLDQPRARAPGRLGGGPRAPAQAAARQGGGRASSPPRRRPAA